jgi:hypothetical protein
MKMLATEWPGRFVVSPDRVSVWKYQLSDIPPEAVYTAAMHYVSSGKPHPPAVGEIRKHCIDIRDGALTQMLATDAWVYVLAEIQKHDGSFLELSPMTQAALRGVGTIFDLKRGAKDLSFERSHFMKAYTALAEKEQIERYALPDVKTVVAMNAPQLPAKEEPKQLKPKMRRIDTPPEENEPFVGAGPVSAEVESRMHKRQLERVVSGIHADFSDPYYRDKRKPSQEEIERLNGLVEKTRKECGEFLI